MTPHIINPIPSGRPLPIMHTLQDAAKLNQQERTTFYVSAYLSHRWICDLANANVAQFAEQPDPTKRSFQTGEAWRGFQKYFGKATDAEISRVYGDLMQFAQCDDPIASYVLHAAFPLSVEHAFTGEFFGSRTARHLLNRPKQFITLIRSSIPRLCDWLDAELHLTTLEQWHLMPGCFDPDSKKRELAALGMQQRNFDHLSEQSKARFLNHLADVAVENGPSPDWAAFRQTADNATPDRPWPTQDLDTAIITLWPLVKRYGWSATDLLDVLHKALQPGDLGPCPDAATLVSYCNNHLSLRWSASGNPGSRIKNPASDRSRNQNSKIKNQKSFDIAFRLLHVTDDPNHQTKTE